MEKDTSKKQKSAIAIFEGSTASVICEKISEAGRMIMEFEDKTNFCKRLADGCTYSESSRAFIVFKNADDFSEQTNASNLQYIDMCTELSERDKTLFLFPGNGIYQKKMLNLLQDAFPYFKSRIQELNDLAKEFYHVQLLDEDIEDDIVRQLRVFVSELVIAEFWQKTGCNADYIVGHSMGEYAAACFAGVITEKYAIELLVKRSRILEQCSAYRMAAVEASADTVTDLANSLGVCIEISAYNAPQLVTVSGRQADIEVLYQGLKNNGIHANLINTNYGGHFSALEPYAEEFSDSINENLIAGLSKNMISTVCPGDKSVKIGTAKYWAAHIFKPVQFEQALGQVPVSDIGRVIDVGVTPVLLGMAMRNIVDYEVTWIPSVRAGRNYRQQMLRAVGLAFNSGVNLNWELIFDSKE